tara:strand:- start:511 stop:900 length:390 start_codon:yes stop_codon:yes gene_type:complete
MANKNVKWTVVFKDKRVINQSVKNDVGSSTAYKIDSIDWDNAKFADVHAIQYIPDGDHDNCVEMTPGTFGRNKTWAEANLGDFQTQFIDKWDAEHLSYLQAVWDDNNVPSETAEQKINRIGARPTSYSS